jgi:hypothetical protein
MPILPNLIDGRGKPPRQATYYAGCAPAMSVEIRSARRNLKGVGVQLRDSDPLLRVIM